MTAYIIAKYIFPTTERDVWCPWPPLGFSDSDKKHSYDPQQPQHPCSKTKWLSRLSGDYTQHSHVQQKPFNALQTISKTFHTTTPLSVCNEAATESAKAAV